MPLRHHYFWIAAFGGLILDRISKHWVMADFTVGEVRPVWPGILNFTYVLNPGAAFSLFREGGEWLRWLSLGVSLFLAAWAWWGPKMINWEQWGYGFIFSGAFGNGIDRFAAGEVVDFLQVPWVRVPIWQSWFEFHWITFPVFNLADVFINVGIICLLIATFWPSSRGKIPPA